MAAPSLPGVDHVCFTQVSTLSSGCTYSLTPQLENTLKCVVNGEFQKFVSIHTLEKIFEPQESGLCGVSVPVPDLKGKYKLPV